MISIKIMKAWVRFSSSKSVFQLGARGAAEPRDENIRQAWFVFAKQANFFMAELRFTRENHWLLQPLRTSVGGLTAALRDVVETFRRPKKLRQQGKIIEIKKLRLRSTNQPPTCLLLWTRHIGSLTAIHPVVQGGEAVENSVKH